MIAADFRGHSVDLRGHSVDFRGHAVSLRGHTVDFRGHSVDLRGPDPWDPLGTRAAASNPSSSSSGDAASRVSSAPRSSGFLPAGNLVGDLIARWRASHPVPSGSVIAFDPTQVNDTNPQVAPTVPGGNMGSGDGPFLQHPQMQMAPPAAHPAWFWPALIGGGLLAVGVVGWAAFSK